MTPSARPQDQASVRRVGHSIVKAGARLDELHRTLEGARWDMVELDVLALGGELVVAHDQHDLARPNPLSFAEALRTLREILPIHVEIDVDIKGTGYEHAVLDTLRSLDLVPRTLVSTMERSSLEVLRQAAPDLRLGLSIPRVRRNYLAHPLTRPGAYAMLAYLRRVVPGQAAGALRSGVADAIMAHWGIVTPRLVAAVRAAGGELYVWTVDDPVRLSAVHRLGVTGIITNDATVFDRALGGPSLAGV